MASEAIQAAPPLAGRSRSSTAAYALRATVRTLFTTRAGTIGTFLVVFWVLVALISYVYTPYSPYAIDASLRNEGVSWSHPFSTDLYGRDILSRVMVGSRTALTIAPLATLLGLVLGIVIGVTSGYFGGIYDEIVMRIVDGFMAFPTLIILLLILTVVRQSIWVVIVIIGINFAPYTGRVVRSSVLALRGLEYVDAAKMRGESAWAIMIREILPNCWRPIVVEGTTRIGYAIFAAAGLSFLGLGVPPPTPDWGVMVNEARGQILINPWPAVFPAIAIAMLVIGVSLIADGVKEATDG